MAKNFVESGDDLTITSAGAKVAGRAYRLGTLVYVAMTSAAANEPVAARTKGVFTGMARNTGDSAWTVGESLYLEASGNELTKTATANYFGKVLDTTVTGATTSGRVLLNGSAGNKAT